MNEQMQKQFHKRQYPLVRYLGLLLAVALLFTGVTFARYATNSNIAASIGIAAFDVDYTIEGINSTTFGNMDYWQSSGGAWLEQGAGSARTVRIQFNNKGGVAVQPTLRLSGPADFWENIALQIALGDDAGGTFASDSLSTQYVLADLLRVRTGGVNVDGKTPAAGEETHNYTYNDYINWDTDNWDTEPANGATQDQEGVCVFDTAFSDQFGQLGIGQDEQLLGETLQMSGGINADGSGTVTAVRESKYGASGDLDITNAGMTMTIKAEMRTTEKYSIGYSRRDSSGGLPALYLDCQKSMPYYTIEIKADRLVLKPRETKTVILFMTWTNSVAPVELTDQVKVDKKDWETLLKKGGSLSDTSDKDVAAVLGYHFNTSGVPVVQQNEEDTWEETGETTTVRITNTFGESGISSTSYEHIASLSGDDSPFAHPMEWYADVQIDQTNSGTIYKCSNAKPTAYVDISKIKSTIDQSTIAMAMSDNGTSLDYTVATEIGYTTDFRVVLEQASEAPAAQQP